MGKAMILIGDANTSSTAGQTAESVALGYFVDRRLAGDFAPRPPVERWMKDQRERFEKELARLEEKDRSDAEQASIQAVRRADELDEREAK